MSLTSDQLKSLYNPDDLDEIIEEVLIKNLCSEQGQKAAVAFINKLLAAGKTRENGMKLLIKLLPHFADTILPDHYNLWLNYCYISHHKNNTFIEMKLCTLCNLLKTCSKIDQFQKQFVGDYLPNLLKIILAIPSDDEKTSRYSLRCLGISMELYPNWFNNHRNKIEPFLINFLTSSHEEIIIESAAKVYLLFQQTGTAGPDSMNYTKNYTDAMSKLCTTLHSLFNNFFDNLMEVDSFDNIIDANNKFEYPKIPVAYNVKQTTHLISKRITNILIILKCFITESFMGTKHLNPNALLSVICRGLCAHICTSRTNEQCKTVEDIYQSVLLNSIQHLLMEVMDDILISFGSHLLPFSSTIGNLINTILKRQQQCTCFNTNSKYHDLSTKLLRTWLIVFNTFIPMSLQEDFIMCLLKDTSVQKKKMTLKLNTKRKVEQISNDTTERNFTLADEMLIEMKCLNSLKCLQILVEFVNLSTKLSRNIEKFVFDTILSTQKFNTIAPYDKSKKCQKELYELLGKLFIQTNTNFPNTCYLNAAIKLLCNACQTNRDLAIRTVCRRQLDALEKISQPICPSIEICNNDKAIESVSKTNEIQENIVDTAIQSSVINTQCLPLSDDELEEDLPKIVDDCATDTIESSFVADEECELTIETTNEFEMPEDKVGEMEVRDEVEIQNANVDEIQDLEDDSEELTEVELEPPVKKIRDEEDACNVDVDDMIHTFQDCVQEQFQ